MGDRNERLETDVSFKRNDRFSSNLFNLSLSLSLSLSLDSARASPHPQRRRARHREREREKERRSASRRAKKVPRSFSRAVMVPRAVCSEEISNVVEDRSAEEWLKRAKKGLSLTTTHQKQDLRVFLPQPQRGEDVVKPIERPHVLWWSRLRCNRSGSNLQKRREEKKILCV